MARTIAIGIQDFEKIRERDCFYVDKTDFIREWWENYDDVTLIARPRRFGKTLNMSMLNCFFSQKYAGCGEKLFSGLSVWDNLKMRRLQGAYPVINLSFAQVKWNQYEYAVNELCDLIKAAYRQYGELERSDKLSEYEKEDFRKMCREVTVQNAADSLKQLALFLSKHYGEKVIILLDEYDTPMQEAYVGGYWNEMVSFIRSLFNATFKTNPYLERALLTGVTRISKESIFSDLNNLRVITTTSEDYETTFGFTEEEVFASMDEQGLAGDERQYVKKWYDGFTFGKVTDIYNPWSITNYLKIKKLDAYWTNTSSNGLIGMMLQNGSAELKDEFQKLLQGGVVKKRIDEQIVFNQLEHDEDAVWSLLVASGYLKVERFAIDPDSTEYREYELSLTNFEVKRCIAILIRGWFAQANESYRSFCKALVSGDVERMNEELSRICRTIFSFFDTESKKPEKFYHGFVLGLVAELMDRYEIRSNRESGRGRYDVAFRPRVDKAGAKDLDGIVLEFKVKSEDEESLEETVLRAKQQITDKEYISDLLDAGMPPEKIRTYGIAFAGKDVLVG